MLIHLKFQDIIKALDNFKKSNSQYLICSDSVNIENKVIKILADKKAGKDTSALEREIDKLVYALYRLTEDEILIVEGK